jgi:hypothetical protein
MSDLLRHPVEIIRRLRGLPFGDSVTDRLDLAEGAPIAVVAWLANGSRLRQGRLVLGSSPIDCLAWQALPTSSWIRGDQEVRVRDAGGRLRSIWAYGVEAQARNAHGATGNLEWRPVSRRARERCCARQGCSRRDRALRIGGYTSESGARRRCVVGASSFAVRRCADGPGASAPHGVIMSGAGKRRASGRSR